MNTLTFTHPASGTTYALNKEKCDELAAELEGSTGLVDAGTEAKNLDLPDELDVYILLEQEYSIYQCAVCGWYGEDAEPDGDEPVCSDCKDDEE